MKVPFFCREKPVFPLFSVIPGSAVQIYRQTKGRNTSETTVMNRDSVTRYALMKVMAGIPGKNILLRRPPAEARAIGISVRKALQNSEMEKTG